MVKVVMPNQKSLRKRKAKTKWLAYSQVLSLKIRIKCLVMMTHRVTKTMMSTAWSREDSP